MNLPKSRFFIWQDFTEESPSSNRFLQIAFDFSTDTKKQRFYMKRLYTDNFSATKRRLATKLLNFLALTDGEGEIIKACMQSGVPAPEEATNFDVFFGENRCENIEIAGVEYAVVRDAVWLDKVEIALFPLVGCPIMPSTDWKNTTEHVKYHWFVSETKGPTNIKLVASEPCRIQMDGWRYVGTNIYYCPTEGDVGMFLAVVVDYGEDGMMYACACETPVAESKESGEEFIFEKRQREHCSESMSGNRFRVLSYNVLAHLYLNESLRKKHQNEQYFAYCPIQFQMDKYRYPLILRELPGYNADLMFLQEVDFRFQKRFLTSFLKQKGFSAIFNCKGNQVNEGLMVAFRTGRFEAVPNGNYSEKLSRLLVEDPSNSDILKYLEDKEEVHKTLSTRPTILQLVHLRTAQGLDVLAANTHLHFDPLDEEVKILQALLCVRYIASVLRDKFPDGQPQILFAGDFNCQPDSRAVNMIRGQQIALPIGVQPSAPGTTVSSSLSSISSFVQHIKTIIGQSILPLAGYGPNSLVLRDTLPFQCISGSPDYTNYTRVPGLNGFVGCLDYIWASPRIQVERVVPMPEHSQVVKYGALPSKIAPSDHLPLICDLHFPIPP